MIVSAAREHELIRRVLPGPGAHEGLRDRWPVKAAGAPAIGDSG